MAQETWRRGATLYSPDRSTPLHPVELSEGAASLLPGVTRPAVVWTIGLDDAGEPVDVDVRRAAVRSVAQLDYPSGAAGRRLGEPASLHRVAARDREAAAGAGPSTGGAISLDIPDTEVVRGPDGRWTLVRRAVLPIEQHNAEISLLTGICAARIMLDGGVGLLRTLPPPSAEQVALLRRATAALGIPWPESMPVSEVIAGLDGDRPRTPRSWRMRSGCCGGPATPPSTERRPRSASTAGSAVPTRT